MRKRPLMKREACEYTPTMAENETEVDIAGFVRQRAATSEAPYPEIVAFLRSLT